MHYRNECDQILCQFAAAVNRGDVLGARNLIPIYREAYARLPWWYRGWMQIRYAVSRQTVHQVLKEHGLD